MESTKHEQFTGLIAAPFTAMNEDGTVTLDRITHQAELLVRNRVAGAFICGTTGESLSMTTEERMTVAEAWRDACDHRLKLIVHVGHTSLSDAIKLAAHAAHIGADAIGAMPPSFFRPATVDDLVAFCAELAAAAPTLPFYYYHIPVMTGVDLPMYDFLAAIDDRIPNFAGIKFTHENLMDFSRCVRFEGGRYEMLFGRDEILLAGLSLGARGAVGSTYNFAAPIYHAVIEAYEQGDLKKAQREQARAAELVATFSRYGALNAQKAMMKMIGVDCGPVRLPLRTLTSEAYEALRTDLERMGFFALQASTSNAQDVAI